MDNSVNSISQKRVLFVEDDSNVAWTILKFLAIKGYVVDYAPDGAIAWEMFRSKPKGWDLLLTDLCLPNFSGFELAQRVRQVNQDLCVVVISGYLNDKEIDRLYDLNVDDIVAKPFNYEELAHRIQLSILKRHAMGSDGEPNLSAARA